MPGPRQKRQPDQPEPAGERTRSDQDQAIQNMPAGNRLLAAVPADEYVRLGPHMEAFAAGHKHTFYEPGEPITHVAFPLSGVASLLMLDQGGTAVEAGTVGNEGMIGIPVFLGRETTPGKALMQVPGTVLRLPAAVFREQVVDVPGSRLQVLLQGYTHALMVQMAQGVACNRLHTIEQRAARWLLTTRDRVGGPTFPLTQEFLGQMLGVRRAGVSEVASTLQKAGVLTYTRGVITIRDAAGLEARACTCYRIIRDEFDRVSSAR